MSSRNNNQINIPEAREAMDQFKMEAAREVGVDLRKGYNGHLTSREAGSVGGQMVRNMCPVRTISYIRPDRTNLSHQSKLCYFASPLI